VKDGTVSSISYGILTEQGATPVFALTPFKFGSGKSKAAVSFFLVEMW